MADATNFTRKLHHKRVLILGGTSGIGYAVAEAAAEHGMFVTISSSQQHKVDASLASLAQSYPSAKSESRLAGHVCDLGDPATVESNIETLLHKASEDGKLDHVIHTAGDALAIGKLGDMTLEKLQRAGLVRFFSAQLLAKHAPAHMVPRGRFTPPLGRGLQRNRLTGSKGSITFTTGQVSEKPMPGWGAVNGFATGIHGMTRGLALDLKPIRVNAVSPGAVDTPLWGKFVASWRDLC